MFLNYRYAFMAKEKTQIGAALGIGLIFLRADDHSHGRSHRRRPRYRYRPVLP